MKPASQQAKRTGEPSPAHSRKHDRDRVTKNRVRGIDRHGMVKPTRSCSIVVAVYTTLTPIRHRIGKRWLPSIARIPSVRWIQKRHFNITIPCLRVDRGVGCRRVITR